MAIIKCKMCGGDIELAADKTFGTCEFCGSTMTFPKVDDEQRAAAFNRGNHFRRIGEFDKALAVYERIVREDDTDAEAHWCCALCRFGIEYVEDPATYEYLPTCHRASFDSFLEDVDYLAAVEHSEGITRRQYQKDAARIAEVQRGILATSQNAQPYDVFICYKESDEKGERTRDSLMAQDIYYQLTEQGRRVFFARITLEDIAGSQYEPYIFAALNSAKVMIVVGTKPEYLNAVWVKNEWSRFLAMMKKDRHKLLLPCYRDMDPYDMPEALSVLQSYDMGKIGFIQDLTRGISKVLDAEKKPEPVKQAVVAAPQSGGANIEPLLERVFMFLEDEDWDSANEYCEKVLDIDPKNPRAYLGKLMAELQVCKVEDLADEEEPFDDRNHYEKAMRFADEDLKATLTGYIAYIEDRNEKARVEDIYTQGQRTFSNARSERAYLKAAALFEEIPDYRDASDLAEKCREEAEVMRKEETYAKAVQKAQGRSQSDYEQAINILGSIPGWRDADELVERYQQRVDQKKAEAEARQQERERQAELARKKAERIQKRNRKIGIVFAIIGCLAIAFVILLYTVIIPNNKYQNALTLMEEGKKAQAAMAFASAGDCKDAPAQKTALWDQIAVRDTISTGNYHTVGLKADGTVVAVGKNEYGRCDVSDWRDIVAISAGSSHTVGLKADGTVVAVGYNQYGRCDVFDWRDIVAISAGYRHTVGLKADGTVVAVGYNGSGRCDASNWRDIVAISAGYDHTVGLKADGTVVAVGYNGYDQCDVSDWRDIVAISAGYLYTIGLKADGTVVAVGSNNYGECDVSYWRDIVAISAGSSHTVGLKADGTVVAVGYNQYGRCDVSDWRDIVAISAGEDHTVGLKADGTVLAVGNNKDGQCDVTGWRNIKTPKSK